MYRDGEKTTREISTTRPSADPTSDSLSPERTTVLYVDDPDFTDLTVTYLKREDDPFAVETAIGASERPESLSEDVDCVISDSDTPGTNGFEFFDAVRAGLSTLPYTLFTGEGSEKSRAKPSHEASPTIRPVRRVTRTST